MLITPNYPAIRKEMVMLNADGSLSNSFIYNDLYSTVGALGYGSVTSQIDGSLILGGLNGYFIHTAGVPNIQSNLCRINANGVFDTSFRSSNITITSLVGHKVYVVKTQNNNSVLIGGNKLFKIVNTLLSTNDFTKSIISLYPNPVKDILNITLSENTSIENYEIYDLLGKKVMSKNTTQNTVNISGLSKGIYLLKVLTNEGIITNKFIKE